MSKPHVIAPDYAPRKDILSQRIVLITGAGDGLGKAVAKASAAHGATVVLLGRTLRKLEAVYDQITDAGGPQPAIYPMDLSGAQPEHYADLAQRLQQEFGRLDSVLHNAATLGTLSPIEHYDALEWQQVMQVNVNAAFLLSRACIGLLKAADDATIVFTSSSVGRLGRAYWGAYAASKFACEGMCQVLAAELEGSTPIRVNAINPGRVRTAMRAAAYPGEDPTTLPTPEQVASRYLYVLGPDSAPLTGQTFDVQAPAHTGAPVS